jgi:hypothetical protein
MGAGAARNGRPGLGGGAPRRLRGRRETALACFRRGSDYAAALPLISRSSEDYRLLEALSASGPAGIARSC